MAWVLSFSESSRSLRPHILRLLRVSFGLPSSVCERPVTNTVLATGFFSNLVRHDGLSIAEELAITQPLEPVYKVKIRNYNWIHIDGYSALKNIKVNNIIRSNHFYNQCEQTNSKPRN